MRQSAGCKPQRPAAANIFSPPGVYPEGLGSLGDIPGLPSMLYDSQICVGVSLAVIASPSEQLTTSVGILV
jgi:hypothetical protein